MDGAPLDPDVCHLMAATSLGSTKVMPDRTVPSCVVTVPADALIPSVRPVAPIDDGRWWAEAGVPVVTVHTPIRSTTAVIRVHHLRAAAGRPCRFAMVPL